MASMALEVLGRGITKFDGTDFQTWKFEVKQLLMVHGLEDIVEGVRERPAGGAKDPTVKTWIKDNAKVMSLISMTIERKQLRGLITCTTAKDMWTSLSGYVASTNKSLPLASYYSFRDFMSIV